MNGYDNANVPLKKVIFYSGKVHFVSSIDYFIYLCHIKPDNNMTKERFNKTNLLQLDNKLFQKIEEDSYPLGLAYGYTGLSLYLFERAKITGDHLYEKYATQCIEHVYHEFTNTMTLGVYNGYASISLGLNILSHLGYIKTSPKTFHDINELCFKNMNYVSNKYPDMINKLETNELTLLLDYFCKQFTYNNIRNSEDLAYRKLIIKIIDFLYTERLEDFLNPPLLYTSDNVLMRYLHGLYEAFHLGIHQTRIMRILDSLSYFVCSLIPMQMASRLQLLYVMLKISTFYNTDIWHKHIKLLHENIDAHVLLKESYDKALFYDKGLASVILLLDGLNKEFPQFIINYNEKDFYEKIATSLAWKQLFMDDDYFQLHSSLFCGYPGLILVCNKKKWL